MLTKEQKNKVIAELTQKLKDHEHIVLTDYQGLKTEELLDLRAKLRPLQSEYRILKNSLSERAFDAAEIKDLRSYLEGPTAVVFSKTDLIGTAKVITTFAKEHDKLKIKACYSQGTLYLEKDLKALAELPPRGVLLAKLVGLIASPLARLRGALEGPIRGLVVALDAIAKKKQETSQ